MRRKRCSGDVDIEMPQEVQKIKTYVDSLKIWEAKHRCEECDAVAEKLTKDQVVTLETLSWKRHQVQ